MMLWSVTIYSGFCISWKGDWDLQAHFQERDDTAGEILVNVTHLPLL